MGNDIDSLEKKLRTGTLDYKSKHGIKTVSYTHLDVYKRQNHSRFNP